MAILKNKKGYVRIKKNEKRKIEMPYILKIKEIEVPFCIKNYKTAKTMKILFKEDGIVVTKPFYVPKREVEAFLQINEEKIYEKYKNMEEIKRQKEGRWQTGQTILYHGEEYRIDKSYHNKDIIRVRLEKESKIFRILLPEQIQKEEENAYIKQAVRKLFKENTEFMLQEKLPYWSKKTNISYNSVQVRDAKTKYGSCIPKTKALHFSSRLVMLKEEAVDAIIVHELCHIVHPNHSKDFYTLVEKYMPNYKEIDKYLKQIAISHKLTI